MKFQVTDWFTYRFSNWFGDVDWVTFLYDSLRFNLRIDRSTLRQFW